jgi:hypothetical protein
VPTRVKTGCNQKLVVIDMATKIWSPFFENPIKNKNKNIANN